MDEIVLVVWTFKQSCDTHEFGFASIEGAVAFIKRSYMKFKELYGSDKEFNFFISDLENGLDIGFAIVRIMSIQFYNI